MLTRKNALIWVWLSALFSFGMCTLHQIEQVLWSGWNNDQQTEKHNM